MSTCKRFESYQNIKMYSSGSEIMLGNKCFYHLAIEIMCDEFFPIPNSRSIFYGTSDISMKTEGEWA